MIIFFQAVLFSFAALFPIVNPLGASVVFLSLIEGATTQEINNLAFRIALYVVVMLLIVLFAGSVILRVFGVSVFFGYRYSHYIIDKLKGAGKNVLMCLAAFLNICIGLQIAGMGLV